eukprot:3698250-Rhodomonas_salina.5
MSGFAFQPAQPRVQTSSAADSVPELRPNTFSPFACSQFELENGSGNRERCTAGWNPISSATVSNRNALGRT